MTSLFQKLLGEATRLTRNGKLIDATATIQRALGGAMGRTGVRVDENAGGGAVVLDGLVREIPRPAADRPAVLRRPVAEPVLPADRIGPQPATFEEGTYTGLSGTRSYKLFVPAGYWDKPLPLIVMLHGCTQSPDDFAAGTGMNELAQERGFLVLYPAQAPRSNSSKCWNWFVPGDQRRGAGEPELLAGMTRHIMATHPVDPARVYIAGLSAGGAMADIMGREYPDLYAAVGIHSGLPQGAASDMVSAFAAMHHGSRPDYEPIRFRPEPQPAAGRTRRVAVPTIVFHGDLDATVHPSNGAQVIDAVLGSAGVGEQRVVGTSEKSAAAGRPVTRTVHRRDGAAIGEPSLAEHWVVHGAGHAWSGGRPTGSYTDAAGPDASREMVRFFEEHPPQRLKAAPPAASRAQA